MNDDAFHSLAQEAIALVNFSNAQKLMTDIEDLKPTLVFTPSHTGESNNLHAPLTSSVIHPLLQIKANLIARREGKIAVRKLSIHEGSPSEQSPCSSTRTAPRISRKSDAVAEEKVSVLSLSPDVQSRNISMKSLLVTLEHQKSPDQHDTTENTIRLPSFRDVFHASNNDVHVPTELKCKYRTGKCNNVRALKSCGEYHNLCHHHRLRANANQRKLDRKKKVQRQKLTGSQMMDSTAPEG
jgi:hypothetical protein